MFERFRNFWQRFWGAFKSAYNSVFKNPIDTNAQDWRQVDKFNLLAVVVNALNNLCNIEATFDVIGGKQTEQLKDLAKDLEERRFDIFGEMAATGDYWCFPATDEKGNVYHTYLTQQQVRILDMNGNNITEAYGIIDWYIRDDGKVFYLLRHHKLDEKGNLTISYQTVNESGNETYLEKWAYLDNETVMFSGANHIGFGRYKSPTSSRGLSPVYGVPLNYGCADIEKKIFNDIRMIESEYKNAESKIFTDPRNLRTDENGKWHIADNIFAVQSRAGATGSMIDVYNPAIRASEHFSKLQTDLALYEKAIGTSRGILTESEATSNATATEIRRANANTVAMVDRLRSAIDEGNRQTLEADAVYMNVQGEWTYTSDWYDSFENPSEQWQRLLEAKANAAAETSDLVRWMFPDLTAEEIEEKQARIAQSQTVDTQQALERILAGQ